MGIFSGYVLSGALATTLVVGAVGFSFTGGETVDNVKVQLLELKDKVLQYEAAEGSLFDKIGFIKADATAKLTDANGKIVSTKAEINNLKANKSLLESQIKNLNNEVTGLKSDKETLTSDLAAANTKIADLETSIAAKDGQIEELSNKVTSLKANIQTLTSDLATANSSITELNGIIVVKNDEIEDLTSDIVVLQGEYDTLLSNYNALVSENEANESEAERANAEVEKANNKVAELEVTSTEVAAATEDAKPMTQAELDAIDTVNTPDVYDAELVVQNLGLTFIQNGQSDEFKSEHPDLNIQDGERVWRVNNSNAFDVYVEYKKGSETGQLVANTSQTYYLTETGGTMIIKWQDENGVWKQTTKAGA